MVSLRYGVQLSTPYSRCVLVSFSVKEQLGLSLQCSQRAAEAGVIELRALVSVRLPCQMQLADARRRNPQRPGVAEPHRRQQVQVGRLRARGW